MAKQERKVSFTFVDPNRAADVEKVLYRILIEKLSAQGKLAVIPAA